MKLKNRLIYKIDLFILLILGLFSIDIAYANKDVEALRSHFNTLLNTAYANGIEIDKGNPRIRSYTPPKNTILTYEIVIDEKSVQINSDNVAETMSFFIKLWNKQQNIWCAISAKAIFGQGYVLGSIIYGKQYQCKDLRKSTQPVLTYDTPNPPTVIRTLEEEIKLAKKYNSKAFQDLNEK